MAAHIASSPPRGYYYSNQLLNHENCPVYKPDIGSIVVIDERLKIMIDMAKTAKYDDIDLSNFVHANYSWKSNRTGIVILIQYFISKLVAIGDPKKDSAEWNSLLVSPTPDEWKEIQRWSDAKNDLAQAGIIKECFDFAEEFATFDDERIAQALTRGHPPKTRWDAITRFFAPERLRKIERRRLEIISESMSEY